MLVLYIFSFSFQCSVPLRDLHSFPTRRSSDLCSMIPCKPLHESRYTSKTTVAFGFAWIFLTFAASFSEPMYTCSRSNTGQTGTLCGIPAGLTVATRATLCDLMKSFSVFVSVIQVLFEVLRTI